MVNNFLKFMENKPQIQETQRILNKEYLNEKSAWHIVAKILIKKNEENMWQAIRGVKT